MANRMCQACEAPLPKAKGRPRKYCKDPECQKTRVRRTPSRIKVRLTADLRNTQCTNGLGPGSTKRRATKPGPQDFDAFDATQLNVLDAIRAGSRPVDAVGGWMVPEVVRRAIGAFTAWLEVVRVVPPELPDDLPDEVRFGMACAQAEHAWRVQVGQLLSASPVNARDIWVSRQAPPDRDADPQAAAIERVKRAREGLTVDEDAIEPDAAITG